MAEGRSLFSRRWEGEEGKGRGVEGGGIRREEGGERGGVGGCKLKKVKK